MRAPCGTLGATLAMIVSTTLAGCQGTGWPVEGEDWALPTCTDGRWTPLADFEPADAVDGIELVIEGIDSPPEVGEVFGTPCSTASDAVACADAVAAAESGDSLVSTAGDTVEQWQGVARVLEFLGPIDHPSEAVALAWADGDDVRCDTLDEGAMREAPEGGFDVVTTHYTEVCAPLIRVRTLRHVTEDGAIEVVDDEVVERSSACIGRRPPGLAPSGVRSGRAVGRWLARAAELEAASVHAFEHLAIELVALGAPEDLVARAREAADDERRHATAVGDLSRRYGCEAPAPRIVPTPLRSLVELCRDNASEGCVRETWGAMLGAWQARTSPDAAVASAMGPIAEDETRHAELSFAIAAWAEPRLQGDERAQVDAARLAAIRALREEAGRGPIGIEAELGLPVGPLAARLLDSLEREVWRAA